MDLPREGVCSVEWDKQLVLRDIEKDQRNFVYMLRIITNL